MGQLKEQAEWEREENPGRQSLTPVGRSEPKLGLGPGLGPEVGLLWAPVWGTSDLRRQSSTGIIIHYSSYCKVHL